VFEVGRGGREHVVSVQDLEILKDTTVIALVDIEDQQSLLRAEERMEAAEATLRPTYRFRSAVRPCPLIAVEISATSNLAKTTKRSGLLATWRSRALEATASARSESTWPSASVTCSSWNCLVAWASCR